MKRIICLIVAALLIMTTYGCSDESAPSTDNAKERIAEVEELCEQAWDAYESCSHGYDAKPYLNEVGEIIQHEWIRKYLLALEAYNALSEDEKAEVYSGSVFTLVTEHYEDLLTEQEMVLKLKDACVESIKESLVNKSSYEEYGWTLGDYYYFTVGDLNGDFHVELTIEYSATNKMGGRIDDSEEFDIRGTYKNGQFSDLRFW